MPKSKLLILSGVLLLALIGSVLYIASSNIDRSPRLEVNRQLNFFLSTKEIDPLSMPNLEYSLPFRNADSDFCININGTIPTTPQEKLTNFIKGPCSPVVVVPGIGGSRLRVLIDCETLQTENPTIFSNCGWSTCGWSLIGSRPDSEYALWIGDFGTDINPFDDSTCFGDLIGIQYNANAESVALKYSSPLGATVKFYGNTPQTNGTNSRCGFAGIEDLLPLPFQETSTYGFTGMEKYMNYMGYQYGLSMFAVPYDFRQTTLANTLPHTLQRTIELAYTLTGKKVIIIAHSMGNFGTLWTLNQMNQTQKDQMVMQYVQLCPPLLGAAKAVRTLIGGDNEFYKQLFGYDIGFSFFAEKELFGSSSAVYDLLPKPVFYYNQGQPWLNEVIARINLEKDYNITTSAGQQFWNDPNVTVPFAWFPTPNRTCFEDGFWNRSAWCRMVVDNWLETSVVQVNGQNYSTSFEDTIQWFNDITFSNYSADYWGDAFTNSVQNLTNPGVPVITIYGSHNPAEKTVVYESDPAPQTKQGFYVNPTAENYTFGDGTVPSTAALLPALKWAWEFDNNAVPNAQPVKTVEWCSLYNLKENIYDTNFTNQTNEFLHNEYVGLNCTCQPGIGGSTSGYDCDHTTIMNDLYFVYFFADMVKTFDRVNSSNIVGLGINSTALKTLQSSCPSLTYNASIQDPMMLLETCIGTTTPTHQSEVIIK